MDYTGVTISLIAAGIFVIWQGDIQAEELQRQANADSSAVRSMIAGKTIQQLYGLLQNCEQPESYRLSTRPSGGHCAEVWRAIGSEDIQLVGVDSAQRFTAYAPSADDYGLLR